MAENKCCWEISGLKWLKHFRHEIWAKHIPLYYVPVSIKNTKYHFCLLISSSAISMSLYYDKLQYGKISPSGVFPQQKYKRLKEFFIENWRSSMDTQAFKIWALVGGYDTIQNSTKICKHKIVHSIKSKCLVCKLPTRFDLHGQSLPQGIDLLSKNIYIVYTYWHSFIEYTKTVLFVFSKRSRIFMGYSYQGCR